MAELADAQRSGRCLVYPSTGSTPASGIRLYRSCGLVGQCLLAYKSFFSLHVSLRTINRKNAII